MLHKALGKTERVVDVGRTVTEVITVVMLFKKCNGGGSINVDCAGELIDPHRKLPRQLFLGNAANRRIALIHRDVAQVVELAKDRKLAELGNAGDKDELQVFVTGFERRTRA